MYLISLSSLSFSSWRLTQLLGFVPCRVPCTLSWEPLVYMANFALSFCFVFFFDTLCSIIPQKSLSTKYDALKEHIKLISQWSQKHIYSLSTGRSEKCKRSLKNKKDYLILLQTIVTPTMNHSLPKCESRVKFYIWNNWRKTTEWSDKSIYHFRLPISKGFSFKTIIWWFHILPISYPVWPKRPRPLATPLTTNW